MSERHLLASLLLLAVGCDCGREPPAADVAPPAASREATPAEGPGGEAAPPPETPGPAAAPVRPASRAAAGAVPTATPWKPSASDQQMQGVVLEALHEYACDAHPEDDPACLLPLAERPIPPEARATLARFGDRMTAYLVEEYARVRKQSGDARPVLRILAASGTRKANAFLDEIVTGRGAPGGGGDAAIPESERSRYVDDAARALVELPGHQAMLTAIRGYEAQRASASDVTLVTFVGVAEDAALRDPVTSGAAVAWLEWLRDREGTSDAVRARAVEGLACLEEGRGCRSSSGR
jgi:hypothetical protein